MQDYNKLKVFHLSNGLTKDIFQISEKMPTHQKYTLRSQIEKSSTSIPTNIVEGCGRKTQRDKAHFFQIAYGSACELEYQIRLIRELRYMSQEDFTLVHSRALELKKMLNSLVRKMWERVDLKRRKK